MAATYFASVRESALAANKRHMSVFNAAGSGVTPVIYKIRAAGTPTGTVAGQTAALAALRLTAAPTGGTVTSFAKAKPGGPDLPPEVTVREAHTAGTVEAIAFGLGAVSGEETASAQGDTLYEAPIDGSEIIEIPEGFGFEVRQLSLASAGAVSIVAIIGAEAP